MAGRHVVILAGGPTDYPDSGTVTLTFTPHQILAATDAATLGLSFTPSGTEVYTPPQTYIDSGSVYLTLTASGIPSYWDSATVPVGFVVTTTDETYTHPPAAYTDSGTLYLDFTPITEHECIAHFRVDLVGYPSNRFMSVSHNRFATVYEYNRFTGEVTSLPVPDPC